MANSLVDAADREAAWLSTEPLAGFPPLLKVGANGGFFDVVMARPRRLSQKPKQIHVYRSSTVEQRENSAYKTQVHTLTLVVLWPRVLNDEQAHTDQLQLDTAIESLVARVRGLQLDHTHGGRFWSVGEIGGLLPGVAGQIDVRMPDWRSIFVDVDQPIATQRSYIVEVVYPAVDFVSG